MLTGVPSPRPGLEVASWLIALQGSSWRLQREQPERFESFGSTLVARGFWVCHETQWSRHTTGSSSPFQGEA